MTSFNKHPVPIEQSLLVFIVLEVHVLYNSSVPAALVVSLYWPPRAKYHCTVGQMWPTGQSLTPMSKRFSAALQKPGG